MTEETSSSTQNSTRRTFCKAAIGGLAGASAAMVGYPIIAFLQNPEKLGAGKPLVVPLDRLTAGQAQYGDFQGQQVIVLMGAEGPKVFSASCPHLGCNVIWDAADGIFRCPCHGAMFDAAGSIIRGPVNAPLTKLPFEVKEGKVVVGA